ncbi:MAG: hypothetical protein KDD67_02050 [Ignavibacteriae bacterium]|nr:hypothetical protein [Ignavibacteriota bacterium]MCB9215398.1 hypothetical protein [Ignavibacteria bacterium]
MVNRIIVSALLFATTLFFVACSDDPTSSTPNGSMTAKVDGDAWGATSLSAQNVAGNLIIVGSQIDIAGGETKQINMTVSNAAVGEYQLGGINSATGRTITYAEGASVASLKSYSSISGTIKIDELTSTGAKGSFTTTVEHNQSGQNDGTKHEITEGKFNVTF